MIGIILLLILYYTLFIFRFKITGYSLKRRTLFLVKTKTMINLTNITYLFQIKYFKRFNTTLLT